MILYSGILNQLQNWIMRELVFLELDYEGANIPIGPSDPHYELIYLVDMGYEGRISSRFTFVHKSILVITQSCIGVSEQDL